MRMTFLLLVVAMMTVFQNCSEGQGVNHGSVTPSGSTQLANNGGNYDGKSFALRDLVDGCADGDPVITLIEGKGGKFYLRREDCIDLIPAPEIPVAQLTLDSAAAGFVIYKQQALVEQGTPAVPSLVCNAQAPGGENAVAMVYAVSGGFAGRTVVYAGPGQQQVLQDTGTIALNVTSGLAPGFEGISADGYHRFEIYSRNQPALPAGTNGKLAVHRAGTPWFNGSALCREQ